MIVFQPHCCWKEGGWAGLCMQDTGVLCNVFWAVRLPALRQKPNISDTHYQTHAMCIQPVKGFPWDMRFIRAAYNLRNRALSTANAFLANILTQQYPRSRVISSTGAARRAVAATWQIMKFLCLRKQDITVTLSRWNVLWVEMVGYTCYYESFLCQKGILASVNLSELLVDKAGYWEEYRSYFNIG